MKKERSAIDSKAPILPIGTIAKALGVSQRMLRIYDKEEILTPGRSLKNRRYYSLDDIEKGRFIIFLTRNFANKLEGVKLIIKLLDECKVKPKDYMKYTKKLADKLNINLENQNEEIQQSKRGRKPKK